MANYDVDDYEVDDLSEPIVEIEDRKVSDEEE
jgi:hypothetical protein